MVACHGGAGPALRCVCRVNGVWLGSSEWLIPTELRTQRGGEERYRNIISHEYASIPLLWWSWDFRIEECWITHRHYLDKLAALWCTGIVRKNMWPSLTLSRNQYFIYGDWLFITTESTCISSLWRDASILLPALEKKEPSLANKRVSPVDIFPSVSHFDHPKYFSSQERGFRKIFFHSADQFISRHFAVR